MMLVEEELQKLVQAVSPDYEFDPLNSIEPTSFTSDEDLIDPVARITEPPEREPLTPIQPSFTEQVANVDQMTTTPKERKQAEKTFRQSTPGSSAAFRAADSATGMTTGDFVMKMLAKEGMEYEWGGTTAATGFDCSGIIFRIMQNAGHTNFPRTSGEIYNHSKKISLKKAINTRGAILWHEGHIAISLGNGKTIEAMGEAYGVVKGNAEGRFTGGGLLPELKVGQTIRRAKKGKAAFRLPKVKAVEPDITLDSLVSAPIVFGSIMGEVEGPEVPTAPNEKPANAPGLKFVPKKYRSWITEAADKSGLSPRLIAYVMQKESGFSEDVVNFQRGSSAGARGGMQLMPFWADTYGDRVFKDPRYNVISGAKILAAYIKQQGNLRDGLAAYNAGPGNLSAGFGYADSILDSFLGRAA